MVQQSADDPAIDNCGQSINLQTWPYNSVIIN